jgi:hypothetical protein
MGKKAYQARLIIAVFTVAMFYASVCSASCGVGVCLEQTHRTAGHDCGQMPSHHSVPSGHQAPDKPDCSQHQHPELFVLKSGGQLPQFQLNIAHHLPAAATNFSALHGLTAVLVRTAPSEHAPPNIFSSSLYDRNSVLRL